MNGTTLARLLAPAAAAAVVLTGCAGGTETTGNAPPPSEPAAAQDQRNQADIEFAQGMIPHHRGAVAMAELAAGRTDNPQIVDLAAQIAQAQEPEIATMTAWLQEWGAEVPQPGAMDGGMAGMDHGGMNQGEMEQGGMDQGGGMAGMMSPEQMSQLEQASGAMFDRMFLEMMIEHHRGAVQMAEVELREGADPEAQALARTIIDTQQAEIAEMEQLLQQL